MKNGKLKHQPKVRLPFEADYELSGLPFDFDQPEAAPAGASWQDIVLQDADHVRLVGPTRSGKTILAEILAAAVPGKIIIIDPVYDRKHWGGLPAVTIATDGSFGPIADAIVGLADEMKRRTAELQQGHTEFERLTIFWDEVPNTVAEVPQSGELIRRLGNYGRHVNMHLIGMGQSSRVGSWGIEGFGDASENFSTIYLGSKALEVMPQLRGQSHPAVLEYQGQHIPIDMTGSMEAVAAARKELAKHPERVFHLPETPKPAELSTAPAQLSSKHELTKRLYRRVRLAFRKQFESMASELSVPPATPPPPAPVTNIHLPPGMKLETPPTQVTLNMDRLADALLSTQKETNREVAHLTELATASRRDAAQEVRTAIELATANQKDAAQEVRTAIAAQAAQTDKLVDAVMALVKQIAQQRPVVVNPAKITVMPAPVTVQQGKRCRMRKTIIRDRNNEISGIVEEPEDDE